MKYIIGIIGSREFYEMSVLNKIMDSLIKKYMLNEFDLYICSGGARGADTLAQNYAKENGLSIIIYYPDWKTYGKEAGFRRNALIASQSDLIIALWDGQSKGTMHTVALAEELNKKVIIYDKSTGDLKTNYTGGIL